MRVQGKKIKKLQAERKAEGKRRWSRLGMLVTVTALAAGLSCVPAYAAGWVRNEEQQWFYAEEAGNVTGWKEIDGDWHYFDDAGIMQTGWVKAADDGLWYYLDEETGVWRRRPVLNDTAVEKLLENEIKKAGYYQHEDGEISIHVDWRDETNIYASVREQTGPNDYTIWNNYVINKKSGGVHPAAGKNFELFH